MNELTEANPTPVIFDAQLAAIDSLAQTATFTCGAQQYTRRLSFSPFWEPGIIGALRLHPDGEHFNFYTYPDQRLRRAPERDRASVHWWSWVIDGHHLFVRAGIIPGIAAAVVRDECQSLDVPIPPEFTAYCQRYDFEPRQLLRA